MFRLADNDFSADGPDWRQPMRMCDRDGARGIRGVYLYPTGTVDCVRGLV